MNVVTPDSDMASLQKGIPLSAWAGSETPAVPNNWGEKTATASDAITWPLLGPAFRGFSASANWPSTGRSDADDSDLSPACLYSLSIDEARDPVAHTSEAKIFFSRALFETPELEPAFPFIVGHEAAHLLLRHEDKAREKFQRAGTFLSVSFASVFGSLIDFPLAPLGITAVGKWRDETIAQALGLGEAEAEADVLGYCLARAAGFELAGLDSVMRTLGNLFPTLTTGNASHAPLEVRLAALPRTEEACDAAMALLPRADQAIADGDGKASARIVDLETRPTETIRR
ncbi:hypothetical protein JCM17845_28360 [Iodidimonas gelatinilytica]|uniref:Peptidase M48 domain-containing protein n=1 Tax=Iodidimonas gelatinilytica TaxID=1236966 RepID=A0A5A7N1S9_9PROT|nr:M48 family metalloprotease [Iodidimonas gelatinilytica]GER02213.1 hypothetical protein JCM17845_28360 [Iodidimonas gelatinilytica]